MLAARAPDYGIVIVCPSSVVDEMIARYRSVDLDAELTPT